jgi:hypothetical protein
MPPSWSANHMEYKFHIVGVFGLTRSAVINWRFCLMRSAFRPRACRRLLAKLGDDSRRAALNFI